TFMIEVLFPTVEPGQYTSISVTETPCAGWYLTSIGSIGAAYDNALDESTIRLFKTEVIAKGNRSIRVHTSPSRTSSTSSTSSTHME
ncbi:hypothetical protein ACFWAM_49580, partial [Rhodococcus jostii]